MVNSLPVKAVLFDLDDTLYEGHGYIDQGFIIVVNKIVRDFKLGIKKKSFLLERLRFLYASKQRKHLFNRILREVLPSLTARQINAYVEAELLWVFKMAPRNLKLHKEAEALLMHIKKRGLRIGLITQGHPVNQWHKIFSLNLADGIFEAIEISGNYAATKAKPSPFMFKNICRRLKVPVNRAIYVGNDWETDRGALKAGMRLFLLDTKGQYKALKHKNLTRIDRLSQVEALL